MICEHLKYEQYSDISEMCQQQLFIKSDGTSQACTVKWSSACKDAIQFCFGDMNFIQLFNDLSCLDKHLHTYCNYYLSHAKAMFCSLHLFSCVSNCH